MEKDYENSKSVSSIDNDNSQVYINTNNNINYNGVTIFSKTFSFLAYYVGYPASVVLKNNEPLITGLMIFRTLHWVSGFLLALTAFIFAVVMLRRLKELSIWPEKWGIEAIKDGIKQMKLHYVENKPAKFGKYNIGQKAAAWAMYFLLLH